MIFASPYYLFLLLLLPILAFGFFVFYKNRKSALFSFISKSKITELTNANIRAWRQKYILALIGFLFLILALARIQFGDKQETITQESAEIIIALDVSKSMLAQDAAPDRLSMAKFLLLNVIDQNAGNKIGLIVFTQNAMWQCPMTYDLAALKMFLQDVTVEQLPVGGTQISQAIMLAAKTISQDNQANPRVLLLISDGEDHDSKVEQAIREAEKNNLTIFSVGVGSAQGAPIPQGGGYLKDSNGQTVITKLNPALLQNAAQKTGGRYFNASDSGVLDSLINATQNIEKSKNGTFNANTKNDQFQIFLAIAFFAFLAMILVRTSESKKK